MVIDHIDGNRSNNKLSNLRLVSQSENMNNAQVNGHKGQVRISQYDKDGNFIAKYNSIREAARIINGSEVAIKDAANRHGSSAGYFWIREDQNLTIEELLKITIANKPKSTCIGITQYSTEGKRIGKSYYWILDSQNILISDLINK